MIRYSNQRFDHINENFESFFQHIGVEILGITVGALALIVLESPLWIPAGGLLLGVSVTTLFVKVLSGGRKTMQSPSKSRVISRIMKVAVALLSFTLARWFPTAVLITSVFIGVLVGLD